MKLNQEQLEARQTELNKKNRSDYLQMTDSERAKIDAVDQAMDILTKAGVKAWVFPVIPYKGSEVDIMVQYNNMTEFLEFPNGVASEEDSKQLSIFNGSLAHGVITPYISIALKSEVEGKVAESALKMFYNSAMVGSKYIWENRRIK